MESPTDSPDKRAKEKDFAIEYLPWSFLLGVEENVSGFYCLYSGLHWH